MKRNALLHRCDIFYKLARKQEDLAVLQANIGNYVHFSNSDRLGINYGGSLHPGNPKAVYGFPLTAAKYQAIIENKSDAFYDYGYNKYIYIFGVSGNILNMDNINLSEATAKVREFVQSKYPKGSHHLSFPPRIRSHALVGPVFLEWLGLISKDVFKKDQSGINVLIRGMGYDAIETRNHGFGDDIASQIAVVNPSAVNLIAKVNNPMLTKEDIKQINWYNSPEYLQQQEEKKKERDRQQKEKADLIAQHTRKWDEEKQIYDLERKLWSEKKFDEAAALRQQFKTKWQDLPPL